MLLCVCHSHRAHHQFVIVARALCCWACFSFNGGFYLSVMRMLLSDAYMQEPVRAADVHMFSCASELTKHHDSKFNDRLIERDGRRNKTYLYTRGAHAGCGRADGLLRCLLTSCICIEQLLVVDYALIAA